MYNIIPFIIIILSLGVILFIIVRKFPMLSSVDVEATLKDRQAKLHEKIIIERIKRRISSWINIKKIPLFNNIFNQLITRSKDFYNRLITLEKKHRLFMGGRKKVLITDESEEENESLKEAQRLLERNELEKAEKKFIQSIKINPHNISAYYGLGDIYMELEQYDQSIEIFEHIIKLNNFEGKAFYKLGLIGLQKGNIDVARENFLKAIKIHPHDVAILVGLFDSCRQLNYNEEALSYIKEVVNLEPNNPKYLDSLIEVSIDLKDKNLAKHSLVKLKEVNPENKKIKEYKEKISAL